MIQAVFGRSTAPEAGRRAVIQFVMALSLCLAAGSVGARPTYPPIVESAYTLKPGGKIAASVLACSLCHVSAGPPDLNLYGKDVKGALKAAGTRTLTVAVLHSIDDKDSDGDGFSNGAEFAADTLPGDPNSHPPGAPPAAKPAPSVSNEASTSGTRTGESSGSGGGLRALLLPKHAQHPVLVHFPIGLFIAGLLFDILAVWKKDRNLAYAGFVNLAVAAVSAVATVGSGLLAWQWVYGGAKLEGTLLTHLVLGVVCTLLFWTLLALRMRNKDRGALVGTGYIVVALIGAVLLAVTGHLGGNLSGVNG